MSNNAKNPPDNFNNSDKRMHKKMHKSCLIWVNFQKVHPDRHWSEATWDNRINTDRPHAFSGISLPTCVY